MNLKLQAVHLGRSAPVFHVIHREDGSFSPFRRLGIDDSFPITGRRGERGKPPELQRSGSGRTGRAPGCGDGRTGGNAGRRRVAAVASAAGAGKRKKAVPNVEGTGAFPGKRTGRRQDFDGSPSLAAALTGGRKIGGKTRSNMMRTASAGGVMGRMKTGAAALRSEAAGPPPTERDGAGSLLPVARAGPSRPELPAARKGATFRPQRAEIANARRPAAQV